MQNLSETGHCRPADFFYPKTFIAHFSITKENPLTQPLACSGSAIRGSKYVV